MARAPVERPPPEAVRALIDGEGRLSLRVVPDARGDAIRVQNGKLLVKVRARPQEGAAKAAVLTLIATALGVAKSRIRLIRGASGRDKLIQVEL